MEQIINKQKEFERFIGFPIDSNLESDRNELSEKFIFKMIEECIELRKESPSVMNSWSKEQKEANLTRIKEEMSDVFLFFLNNMITWKIDWNKFLEIVSAVQDNNFLGVKEKKMKMLNESILAIPGYTSGIGNGNLNPKYVFIGQNPGEDMKHGYKFWSNEEDGSSKVLLPTLDAMGIRQDCYFTNLVKCTTSGNREPTENEVAFWKEYLAKEIQILGMNNGNMKMVTMGNFVKNHIPGAYHVKHPAFVLRGGMSIEDYKNEIFMTLL